MTVKEMHIEVNQATQLVAGNARRKLLPEEVDWVLNKVMLRYIGTHATSIRQSPGAAESITHLNRLASVLDYTTVRTYEEPDKESVAAVLPYSVYELLSVQLKVHNLCGAKAGTLRSQTRIHILKVTPTTALTEFYKNVVLTIDGTIIFDMQAYAAEHNVTFNGFPSKSETWRLVPIILSELIRKGYQVFWEDMDKDSFPNSIIIVGIPEASVVLAIDGVNTVALVDSRLRTVYTASTYKKYPGRLHYQTTLPQIEASAFSGTYYRSPLCFVNNRKLQITLNGSFIVGDAVLHHVRKPRPIDVILGINCELPEVAHPDICDLATEYIKQLREDPNWETKLKENMIRTTI
jgi:hypothetical protein